MNPSTVESNLIRTPSLTEIFGGPLGTWTREKARARRCGQLGSTPQARRRPAMRMEALEPRLLLSADAIQGAGFTSLLVDGLATTAEQLQEFIDDDPAFDTQVPGLLRPGDTGIGEAPLVIPTVRELLEVAADQNQDGVVVEQGAIGNLAQRFAYVDARGQEVVDTFSTPPFLNEILSVSEKALEVMDLNNDRDVALDEALKVLVVGQMQQFLEAYPDVYWDGDSFENRTAAQLQADFLSFLGGNDVEIVLFEILGFEITQTLAGFHTPSIFTDELFSNSYAHFFELGITGETHDSAGDESNTFAYSLNLQLEVQDAYLIDLGLSAEQAGVQLPINPFDNPYNDPEGDLDGYIADNIDHGSDPNALVEGGLLSGAPFAPLALSFSVDTSDAFTDTDFTVAFDDSGFTLGVRVDQSLVDLSVNVGFAGLLGDSGAFFALAMPFDGSLSPLSVLGITADQFGDLETDGEIVGSLPLESGNVVSSINLEFELAIGEVSIDTESITITAATTSGNDAVDDLVSNVQAALNAQFGADILVVSLTGEDKLSIRLADSDAEELGFDLGQADSGGFLVNSITATAVPDSSVFADLAEISFLLAFAGEVKRITFTVDDDEDDGVGLDDVLAPLNTALTAAFGGFVTASDGGGGQIELDAFLGSIEIPRALTLDANAAVSLDTLNNADINDLIRAQPDTDNDNFEIDLPLELKVDLDWEGTDPSPSLNIAFDPFDGAPVVEVVIADTLGERFDLAFTSNADFAEVQNFNLIEMGDVISLLSDLQSTLAKLPGTQLLGSVDIPFAEATLASIVDFADALADMLIYDDGDDGVGGDFADTGKLVVDADPDADVVALALQFPDTNYTGPLTDDFGNANPLRTAQELGQRLLQLSDGDSGSIITGTPHYDPATGELTYRIDFSHFNGILEVPIDFDFGDLLAPLFDLSSESSLFLFAEAFFDGIMGFHLGAVQVLDDATPLASLNGNTGVDVKTDLALTGAEDVNIVRGRLSSDANFRVSINGAAPVYVTVAHEDTFENDSIQDLLDDINGALAAGDSNPDPAVTTLVDLSTKLQAIAVGEKITLRAINPDANGMNTIRVEVDGGNAAITQLGLFSSYLSTVSVVAPGTPGSDLTDDYSFDVVINGGTPTTISPASGDAENTSVFHLVDDVNALLAAADLDDQVRAEVQNNRIAFIAIDDDIETLTIDFASNADAEMFGFASGAPVVGGVRALGNDFLAGVSLANGNTERLFGRLSNTATFTIDFNAGLDGAGTPPSDLSVTVTAASTSENSTLQDLVDAVNDAIDAADGTADGNQLVRAELDMTSGGARILLRALDEDIGGFAITSPNSIAQDELGLTTAVVADAHLQLIASKTAPAYYGVSGIFGTDDIAFSLSVEGSPVGTVFELFDATDAGVVDLDSNMLTFESAHGFHDGNVVLYSAGGGGTAIGGLTSGNTYYVVGVSGDSLQLSATQGGAAVDLSTGAAGAFHSLALVANQVFDSATAVDTTTDELAFADGHDFANGDQVLYSDGGDTAVGNLADGGSYFVIVVDANTIQLADSYQDALDGVARDLAAGGAGGAHTLKTTATGGTIEIPVAITGDDVEHMIPNNSIFALVSDLNGIISRAYNAYNAEHGTALINPFAVSSDGSRVVLTATLPAVQSFAATGDNDSTAVTQLKLFEVGADISGAGEQTLTADTADLLVFLGDGGHFRVSLDELTGTDTLGDVFAKMNLEFDGSDSAVVDATDDTVFIGNHGLKTGDTLFYRNLSGGAAIGLTNGATYYAIRTDADHFQVAASESDAFNGIFIALSTGGAGTHSLAPIFGEVNTLTGNSLLVTDLTGLGELFRMTTVNDSDAAHDLGLFKSDVSVGVGTEGTNAVATTPNAKIEGEAIGTIALEDRFFLREVDSSTPILHADVGLTSFFGPLVEVTGRFGFVGVELTEQSDSIFDVILLTGGVDIGLGDSGSADTKTLAEFSDAFSVNRDGDDDVDFFDITQVLTEPVFTFSGDMVFDVADAAGLTGGFFGFGADPEVTISLADAGDPFNILVGSNTPFDASDPGLVDDTDNTIELTGHGFVDGDRITYFHGMGGSDIEGLVNGNAYYVIAVDANHIQLATTKFNATRATPVAIDIGPATAGTAHILEAEFDPILGAVSTGSFQDLAALENFPDIDFEQLIEGLQGVADFLSGFGGFPFMNTEIPLIGVTLNELLGIASGFQSAVDAIVQNQSKTLQEVEQKFRETLHLPPGSSFFQVSLVDNEDGDGDASDLLKISIDLLSAFNEALAIDLDLAAEIGLPFSLVGQAGLHATGEIGATLTFGVDLDDLTNIVLFDGETEVVIDLVAAADNLTFNASLGPLGIFITGGDATFRIDASFRDEDAAAGHFVALSGLNFDDLISSGFEANLTGEIDVTLPVYFPTGSNFVGDITFSAGLELVFASPPDLDIVNPQLDVPDFFNDADLFENFSLFDSLPLLLDGIDLFLQQVQTFIDGGILSDALPFIGDQLSQGADFIDQLREGLIQPLRDAIEQAPEKTGAIVQQFLFQILGPSGIGLLLPSGTDIAGMTAAAVDALQAGVNSGAISFTSEIGGDTSDDFIQWDVLVGDLFTFPFNVNFDLGWDGLGLDFHGGLDVSLGWDFGIGFGVSVADGAYLNVRRMSGLTVVDEMRIFITAKPTDQISATLGFLGLNIVDAVDVTDPGITVDKNFDEALKGLLGYVEPFTDGGNDPTEFRAELSVDLINGGAPSDSRLSFFEIGDLEADVDLKAHAEVNVFMEVFFDVDLPGDFFEQLLPKLEGQFVLDWAVEATDILDNGFDFNGGLQLIEFRHVYVDLGQFIGDVLGPILGEIQDFLDPFQEIIDIISAPLPVISDLAGEDISIIDLAGIVGDFDPTFIEMVADLITFINSIPVTSESVKLLLADQLTLLNAFNSDGSGDDLLDSTPGGLDSFLTSPSFDFGSFDSEEFTGLITDFVGELDLFGPGGFDLGTLASGGGTQSASSMKSLFDGDFNSGEFGFDVPFIKNPTSLLGLLFGQNVALFTYDLAPLALDFRWDQEFPVYPPIAVIVGFEVGFVVDLAFGYDTEGVRRFAEGDFQNPLDLLAGFYISDTDHPDGTFGVDVPEMVFTGGLSVGAGLSIGVASVSVDLTATITINFDLYDPDRDGRVRFEELANTFLFEVINGDPVLAPIAIFDISLEIALQLSVSIEILLFEATFDITPRIVIAEFDIPFERVGILATELDNGDLMLNMGPNAGERLNGDTSDIDEHFIVINGDGEHEVKVYSPSLGIPIGAAQTYRVTGKIIADGGEGNDIIDMIGVTGTPPVLLIGGSGNDTLTGGDGDDTIQGGDGDDVLNGSLGADQIFGEAGNDEIDGGGGNDWLFGDFGSVSALFLSAPVDAVRDGKDTVSGGAGEDVIFGSGKDDELHGGADDDVILGDGGSIPFVSGNLDFTDIRFSDRPGGGNDSIFGDANDDLIYAGSGADTVDGGADDDTIYGQSGFDVLGGGTEADTIYGGTEDDRIYGLAPDAVNADADGDDTLYGEAGNDLVRGNAGNDTLFGGIGSDVMFGDADNDTIFGENEPDYIFGGPDDDWIDAGIDNDIVFGDDGLVAFVGFYDVEKLLGFEDGQTDTGTLTAANLLSAAKPGRDVVFRLSLAGVVYVIELPQSATSDNGAIGDLVGDINGAFATARRESDGAIVNISGDVTASDSGGALVLTATIGTDELIVSDAHRIIGDALLDPSDPIVTTNDGQRKTADLMQTHVNLYQADGFFDGDDTISGGEANDFAFGGEGDDTIFGDFDPDAYLALPPAERPPVAAGRDVLIGDGGRVELFDRRLDFVKSLPSTGAGDDTISGNGNEDVIIGGGGSDTLYGRFNEAAYSQPQLNILDENLGLTPDDEGWVSDEDILIGDDGNIDYDHTISNVLNYIETNIVDADALASGGTDTAFGSRDNDIIFGGLEGDTLDGSVGDDVIFGDNGRIEYDPGKTVADLRTDMTQLFSTDTTDATGGPDDIEGAEGEDIIIGGVNGVVLTETDVLKGSDDKDIILGDNALLRWNVLSSEGFAGFGDDNLATLDLVTTKDFTIGGDDHISGANDDDILIGGSADDLVKGDNSFGGALALLPGSDVAIGDQGRVTFYGGIRTRVQAIDTLETDGGIDTIEGNADRDIIIGGVQGDFLYGEAALLDEIGDFGDDILVGDEGLLRWDVDGLTPAQLVSLDLIESEDDADLADGNTVLTPTLGGVDEIWGNGGRDIAMGGTAGDFIYGDAGLGSELDPTADSRDILLGDNGRAIFVPADGDPVFDGDLGTLGDGFVVWGGGLSILTTTDVLAETGGEDTVDGNEADDVILGGAQGDLLSGNDDNDIILGDEGRLEWLYDGDDDVAGVEDGLPGPEFDESFTTLDLITTFLPVESAPYPGGRDEIYGDTAGSFADDGEDVIFGGTDLDIVQGGPNTNPLVGDVIFGDYGRIYPQNSALPGFPSRNFFAIDMQDDDGGEGDVLYGDAPVENATDGSDIMLGQQGDDRMWGGGSDDDMIGGHNRAGGYDELGLPAVQVTLNPPMNDVMDGGSGDDAMAGDNASMWRTGTDISERFRALTTSAIYTTDADSITANIGADSQSDPDDAVSRDITLLDHSDSVQATPLGRFGADVMAGGADSDVMYGELGDDLMQGDGMISSSAEVPDVPPFISRTLDVDDSGSSPDTDETLYFNIPEQDTDADDYMEGNGGNDLMYGGLGQDDMIGGSSALFGLDDPDPAIANSLRPDGSDIIYGGAGNPVRLERNDFVGSTDTDVGTAEGVGAVPTNDDPSIDLLVNRHSRDADFIMGDNANVYRLVVGGASGTNPNDPSDLFREFNYDQSSPFESRGSERIVVRAMEQLDYTLGGGDFAGGGYNADGQATPTDAPVDNGLADLIYGESGDDYIFGMTGSDVIFGNSDDDDIVGGYGHEWISGGTGQDGVLGDDGLIYTSRNSTLGEPLYGIAGLLASDPSLKDTNGNVLDELISTPGDNQIATIHVSGQLKKIADLTPFSFDADWEWEDDEFPDNQDDSPFADDIIFGGLGSDSLHGGSGDDAISGAEALEHAYVPDYDSNGNPTGVLDLGYDFLALPDPLNPGALLSFTLNPGDVLAFNPVDEDGQHLNNRFRAGEFDLYDEYDPRRVILLTPAGELYQATGGVEGVNYFQFLLNFDETEGVFRASGTVPKATGQQTESYPVVRDDGRDAIFGDLANDWLVGGTGRDDMYGGWGNDLLNADDDHDGHLDTNPLNNTPDTHPFYEDRAYGGAGRDVLIANTGGDRLIDWVGEYNSYLVPFAPFGQSTVSRTLQPFLPEFLYALSASDGADSTRAADTLEDVLRKGEPAGELGLVLQKDFAWQDQTGAPADPQAGNIPGGHRDVLNSAGFNNGSAEGFLIDSGTWAVTAGKFQVTPASLGGDALAVWNHDQYLPTYFEVTATINAGKPTGGFKSNAYIVFDYYGDTDFKFAGIDVSLNKFVIGHRDASGWVVDVQSPVNGSLKAGVDYNLLLALNGTTATVALNGQSFTYTFAPRIDADGIAHNFNEGMIGLGAQNAKATIDNVKLQVVPLATTLTATDSFLTAATLVAAETGTWTLSGGRFIGQPASGQTIALANGELTVGAAYLLQLEAKLSTNFTGGVIFDQYSADDFKWAAIDKVNGKVLLGHYTASKGWVVDASVNRTFAANVDVTLTATLKGSTVSVLVNGQAALSYVYNAVVTDGSFGLLARGGSASFDSFTIRTDDPAFAGEPGGIAMTATGADPETGPGDTLTSDALDAIVASAIDLWTDALGADDPRLAAFDDLEVVIGNLSGDGLGETASNTVTIDQDAAGYGWFIDLTPAANGEFRIRDDVSVLSATPNSGAYGEMDLLTVVLHELGHVLGLDHEDAASFAVMDDVLTTGVRYTLDAAPAGGRPRLDFGDWMWADGQQGPGAAGASTGWDASNGEESAVRTIDWGTGGVWNSHSPFQGSKPGKGSSQNVSDFLLRFK